MQAEDQVAEWLVRWEDALAADTPPPALDELPPELHERARLGVLLLRGFAGMSRALAMTAPDPGGPAPQAPPDTPRYRFEDLLGRGGMGEVWRGFDTLLAREVALKVLRGRLLEYSDFKARFEEEARQVGQLQHPSIVPVYDLGELPDGRPFFVMKLIHGRTLAELLEGRASPAEELPRWVEVFEQVCQAVAFAHERGVIHRDLKPSNVMLGELGEVQVMDWGLAKALAAGPRPAPGPPVAPPPAVGQGTTGAPGAQTVSGQAKGTPAYMAPEQARGELGRVGTASDVFGLGGILCVTLTGEPPFAQPGQAGAADLEEAFARLDGCGAEAELIDLAKACLAPAPEGRPADAGQVAALVKLYRDGVAERCRRAEWERLLSQVAGATHEEEWMSSPAAAAARARFRRQAQEWLRAEVATQAKQLSGGSPAEAAAARQVLELILAIPALERVRNPATLANLPEPERHAWQTFWQEVTALLRGPDDAVT
jgi:hypothetical protein